MATLRWLGHSCFEAKDTTTILTDPHDGASLGLPIPRSRPDAVLISHDHDDHSGGRRLFAALGVEVITEPGEYEVKGIEIKGIKTYHDNAQGSRLGANTVFVFELDGVRFCHTGDLGHPLSLEQIEEMGRVDVLMVGVGGNPKLADENISRTCPSIVIPMHYWTEGIIFPHFQLAKVNDFVKGKSGIRRIQGPKAKYRREDLPSDTEIHILTLRKRGSRQALTT